MSDYADRLAAAIDREASRVLSAGAGARFDARRVRAEMDGRRICKVIVIGAQIAVQDATGRLLQIHSWAVTNQRRAAARSSVGSRMIIEEYNSGEPGIMITRARLIKWREEYVDKGRRRRFRIITV